MDTLTVTFTAPQALDLHNALTDQADLHRQHYQRCILNGETEAAEQIRGHISSLLSAQAAIWEAAKRKGWHRRGDRARQPK